MIDLNNTLFNDSPIGIAIVTLEKNFIKVNPFFCKMLGYSQEEFEKMNVKDITHSNDFLGNMKLVESVASKEVEHFTTEKRYIHKNGEPVWVLITVSKSKYLGEDVFIAQVQNIDPIKKLEIEEKLNSLSAIVTTYHHEINNPLAIAYGIHRKMKKLDTGERELRVLEDSLDRIGGVLKKIELAVSEQKLVFGTYVKESKIIDLQ